MDLFHQLSYSSPYNTIIQTDLALLRARVHCRFIKPDYIKLGMDHLFGCWIGRTDDHNVRKTKAPSDQYDIRSIWQHHPKCNTHSTLWDDRGCHGNVCFHGPFVNEMGSLSDITRDCLLRLLTRPEPLGPMPLGELGWIREGRVRGPIVGGNLSLLCSTLGTAWELETAGRILFLEDRGEKPYKVDRMLVQLKQAGKLSSIVGLLFGEFKGDETDERKGGGEEAMEEVLRENARGLGVPVACGLPLGHGHHNVPLPLGVLAEIDGSEGRVSVLEPAVRPRE